jgi:pimeloyl-ACP methyl ester carboxylesterase
MTANSRTSAQNWVLIRGLVRSRYHWGDFAETLKKHLRAEQVICVELPGNGELFRQPSPSDIDEAVTALRAQLPAGLSSYALFGISLGGMLATRWAQSHADEVQRLVLVNSSSPLSPFYERLNPRHYAGILRTLLQRDALRGEEFIMRITSNRPDKWTPRLSELVEFQAQHPVSWQNFIRQLGLTSQIDFTNAPKCEKLILTSSADQLVDHRCSLMIAKQWQCPVKIHNWAGHDLALDDAEWILNELSV